MNNSKDSKWKLTVTNSHSKFEFVPVKKDGKVTVPSYYVLDMFPNCEEQNNNTTNNNS